MKISHQFARPRVKVESGDHGFVVLLDGHPIMRSGSRWTALRIAVWLRKAYPVAP